MATLSALRADLQRRFQDKNGGFLSAAPADLYLNLACEDFTNDVQPVFKEYGYYVTAYKFRYDLPADYIHTRAMMWYYGGQAIEMPYLSPKEFMAAGLLNKRSTTSTPEAYTIMEDDIYVGPAPAASGNTSTTYAQVGIADTSMQVTNGTKFNAPSGIVLIDSEQIAHQSNTSTATGTLGLLLRGQGGTTAASHSGCGEVVYRLDLVMTYAASHTTITSAQSPAFSARYHRLMVEGALAYALRQDGRDDEAGVIWEGYNGKKIQARREFRKQTRDVANRHIRATYQ